MRVESKVVVIDTEGKVVSIFVYEGTNDAGREDRKAVAMAEAVASVPETMTPTGRKGNGTIYRSENYEIGFLSSGVKVSVGDYL